MERVSANAEQVRTLFRRLSIILFFAELSHGMLLYAIIPDLVQHRFPESGFRLFNLIPVKEEVAGLCLAAYTLAELMFKVPTGHAVDHRGPDVPLVLGLIVSLATVPMILLSRDPHMMLLGSFLHGMGAAPVWPAVISAWTRGRSARERGEIMGQILTWWMAGLGVGLVSGKFLLELSGRAEMVVNYAPLPFWMVTIIASWWLGQTLGGPAAGNGAEEELPGAFSFPPELKVMALGLFLQNLAFGALIIPFNFLAEQQLELNQAQVAGMFVLGGVPAVLLLGPMGRLSDRLGRRRAVIGSTLVVSPLIAVTPLLAYIPVNPWVRFVMMIPGLLVAGVAYASLLPAWHALALGRIPEIQRARCLALLMSVEMAALAGGHALGTPIYKKVSFMAPFMMAGAVFFTLALIYYLGYILPRDTHDDHLPAGGNGTPGGNATASGTTTGAKGEGPSLSRPGLHTGD
jgi:MFS family permease